MITYKVVFDTGADLHVPADTKEEARIMCVELFPEERIVHIDVLPMWEEKQP